MRVDAMYKNKNEKIIFAKSGKNSHVFSDFSEVDINNCFSEELIKKESLPLPNVSEIQVVRHFTNLSQLNYSVDNGFYPLGSCTMKYNPKINEKIASHPYFLNLHPYLPSAYVQGALRVLWELGEALKEITGMDGITLQPSAGAHGEFTGILIMRKYHEIKENKKTTVLIPDSAHGTNPASVAMAGFKAKEIKSNQYGMIDIDDLKKNLTDEVAGMMITNPNTLGLFEENILEIADLIHSVDGLLYNDGANLNAILGKTRPGDLGFDITHLNLHKTFSTPHGGGGPGSGPIAVKKHLLDYLPNPQVVKEGDKFIWKNLSQNSIGKVLGFYGNFQVLVKALVYIKVLGKTGLKEVAEYAVLNANYLKEHLKKYYKLPYDRVCMHEFVLSGYEKGMDVHTLDIAKRLLDYGYHAPTVYFPLIVKEAIMIEPTETESKEQLDDFIKVMQKIDQERREQPEILQAAPQRTPVKRLDEVRAVKQPDLSYR
jgi:glycine dehydrogenase subunit 2